MNPTPPPHPTTDIDIDVADLARRRRQGHALARIAADTGLAYATVRRLLHPPTLLVDVDVDDLARRRRQGHSLRRIAADTGHTYATVRRRLNTVGLSAPLTGPVVDTAALAATYAAGRSLAATAEAHDTTIGTVRGALAKHGVALRPPGVPRGTRPPRPQPPADTAAIADHYAARRSIHITAAHFGLPWRTVRDAITAHGIPIGANLRRLTPQEREGIIEAGRAGHSTTAITAEFDVAATTVHTVLDAAGVARARRPRRSPRWGSDR